LFGYKIPFFLFSRDARLPVVRVRGHLRVAIWQSTACRVHHWRRYPHPLHHAQLEALPHPMYRDRTSLFLILPLHNSSRCRGGGTSLSFSCNQGMMRRHGVGGRACAQYGLLCHGCGGANKEDLDRSCVCRQLRCRSLCRAAGRHTHQGKRVAGWQRASGRRGPAVRHDVGRVKLPCTTDGEREQRAESNSIGQHGAEKGDGNRAPELRHDLELRRSSRCTLDPRERSYISWGAVAVWIAGSASNSLEGFDRVCLGWQ
jgi:hypothetical protein